MGERNTFSDLSDTLKVSKEIMKKLQDYSSSYYEKSADDIFGWGVGDVEEDDGGYEENIEPHKMTCPFCAEIVAGITKEEAIKRIRKHKSTCKENPTNKSKIVETEGAQWKLTLPIWML